MRYKIGVFLAVVAVIYSFLWPWYVKAYDDCPSIASLVEQPLPYQEWYEYDRARADDTARLWALDPDAIKSASLMEWQELARETAQVFSSSYQDPDGMFTIYSANNTGKIHILALARYYREYILKHTLSGNILPVTYPDWLQGGLPAGIPSLSKKGFIQGDGLWSYTVADTAAAIKDINISGKPFSGIAFYLLPFRISGYEGSAYTMNTPGRDEAVYISASATPNAGKLAVLIDHELGHIIHYQYMGSYNANPSGWGRFINLIGETEYINFGSCTQNTDEKFAEWFRIAFGSSLGQQGRTFYDATPDSSDYRIINDYRSLVDDLINEGEESYFDVQRIEAEFIDYQGQSLRLPVGPRPEQINVIATCTPEILFTAPLIFKEKKEAFVPVGACYNTTTSKRKTIDYSYLYNQNGVIHYKTHLPEQGLYTVYLGRKGQSGFTDAMKFQIIYIKL